MLLRGSLEEQLRPLGLSSQGEGGDGVEQVLPRLDLSKHARRQMARRKVSKIEIASLMTNYAVKYGQPHGPTAFCGHVDGRPLKVIVDADGSTVVTVAIWWVREQRAL